MVKLVGYLKAFGKLVFILFLVVLTFVYAMFQGGFVSWFLFYSFIPFGLYSLFLSIYPLKDVKVERYIEKHDYRAGERFSATITIRRKIPFPIFYFIVEELLPHQLKNCKQSKKSKVILFPWFKKSLTFQYEIDAIPRGEHIFKGIRIKTGDLFGLIEKEQMYPIHEQFLIYPQYVDMVYRQIESRFEQGMTASNVNIQRDTAIAVGVRDYKPGDRFSWINWKASARKNDLMIKEFEQQQSHDVVIFLDRTKSNQFEQLVTFTASVVRAILRKGAQVSFVSIGEDYAFYPLRSGEIQQQQIFYHLAKVKDDSSIRFSQIIESETKTMYQAVTFLFATNHLNSDMVKTIERLTSRQANILLFVVKEKNTKLTGEEHNVLEMIRKHNVFVKVVYEGHYSDVFFEVSKS